MLDDFISTPGNNNFLWLQYVLGNIPGPGTNHAGFDSQYEGCRCRSCRSDCACLTRYGPSYDTDASLLSTEYMGVEKPIVECNDDCRCDKNCTNRVVQRGLQTNVEVFNHEKKALGLRTLDAISKNQFVCEYAGEILTHKEAKSRSNLLTDIDMNYILAVKEHLQNGTVLHTYVDPKQFGNVGRFINHSCKPNLFMVPVRVNNSIAHMALFAVRDISIGEELTFDYSGETSPNSDYKIRTHPQDCEEQRRGHIPEKLQRNINRKKCFCSTDQCKGFLPFDESLFVT